ncbi:MAG: NAD(P)/FAD-dependent oxidoreductase [Gammaproteobacteria bacterium]
MSPTLPTAPRRGPESHRPGHSHSPGRLNVAVVGTGISGLGAARMLSERHRVTVFEANRYVGGHTNTIEVVERSPGGRRVLPVDTGFIVFNERNYPLLTELFQRLGVEARDSDMSFSVHDEASGLEYNGTSLNALFAQRRNLVRPSFWGMVRDILRFNRHAPRALESLGDNVPVETWVRYHGYGDAFLNHYLLPLGGSLWSCDGATFARFPMRFVIEFLHNHAMLQVEGRPRWRTVVGGSRSYVAPLIRPFMNAIQLETPVTRVCRTARGVDVYTAQGVERFDEVVMACHADQALALLEDPDADEREVLEHFPYQVNEAVLHTDTSRLPDRPLAWASWNYRIPSSPRETVSVTYNMNKLQGLVSDRTYLVSLNQGDVVAPERIIRRINYEHPLFTPGRLRAQARHAEFIRRNRVSYCGAYWGYGFHEDGLRSGLAVAEAFDMGLGNLERAA